MTSDLKIQSSTNPTSSQGSARSEENASSKITPIKPSIEINAAHPKTGSAVARPDLSIVIPAYLEEENLRILLPRIIAIAKTLTNAAEIIIVDTFEPLDQTKQVCEELKVRYVTRKISNDFGNAVRTGIAEAKGKYLVFMDADGSHTPEFIEKLYNLRDDYDVVIASRYIKGGHTENSSSLVFMSRILNLIYRLVLGLKCHDVSNSFKLYQADQLKSIDLYCANFDVVEEILFKLNRKYKVKIKEIPFTFKKRMFGDTKRNLLVFMFTYFFTLIKLRFGK